MAVFAMTLPSLAGAVDGRCDNTAPDPRWWRTTSGRDRRQPDLGATPAQVAIAWTRARSPAIHPAIGARRLDQLLDNLGAAELDLPAEALARLDAATGIDLGFPATFIRETSPWVFGAAALPGT